jgi:two-component system, NtrC family, response regulator AtoC
VALVDLRLPDTDGIQVVRDLKAKHADTAVIMITAFGHIESAVSAIKNGATDYLEKPFQHLEKLRISVSRALDEVKARREITRLTKREEGKYRADQLIGESDSTRRLREVIGQLARSEAHTILVHGESGTGKELVAKGLHYESSRRNSPFMEVNCAAITETLFESELFGHEKGAFTDARATKKGLMELADRGTLFLDEVGEIALASQAKLLRCLQERSFKRVGGTRDIKVDVRVIAATNRSLDVMVKDGSFREDLFYRLNVIPIAIPPLRERKEDILPLARHFLAEANRTFHKLVKRFAPETEVLLLGHAWPGNVRELKNLVERLVILSTGESIDAHHMPPQFSRLPEGRTAEETPSEARTLAAIERGYILKVMQQTNGNKSEAAKILGITRQTLRKKLTES